MANREHPKVIQIHGIKENHRIESLELMAQLEEAQGVNDDIIELVTRQNEAIEAVIQRLIKGGVYYS